MSKISIGGRIVGEGCPVFIIAEAGVNHNGSIDLAKRLIDAAKQTGADAVKFQTFKAENLSTREAPKAAYHIETTGSEQSWYDLLKSQELDRNAHEVLKEHCRKAGIAFLSTPYDEESADMLEELGVPCFKIASTDANNIPFLRYIARKKLPVILSTAMCTLEEVRESVMAMRSEGCRDLILLHCTANYPTRLADANLRAMLTLRDTFDLPVGYSDHSPDPINPIAATAMGAVVYEKHFTLDKGLPGPDHRSSLDPEEFKTLVGDIRKTESALGSPTKRLTESELENVRKLRKSLVARCDIPSGTILSKDNLTQKRPGTGLPPREMERIIGRKTRVFVPKDTLIDPDHLE